MTMKWYGFKRLLSIVFVFVIFHKADAIDLRPTHVSCQSGGGMGVVSLGIGWCYGSQHRWETDIFLGLVPKYDSESAKVAMALKENFVPWKVNLGMGFMLEPLTSSIYFTTLLNEHVWARLPSRYGEKGYYMLSTKIRANISLGQRLRWEIPGEAGVFDSVSIFYELGTCDIYVLSAAGNSEIKFHELLQLCLGIRLNFRR